MTWGVSRTLAMSWLKRGSVGLAHRQSEERDICLRALLTKEAAADAVIIRGVCDRGLRARDVGLMRTQLRGEARSVISALERPVLHRVGRRGSRPPLSYVEISWGGTTLSIFENCAERVPNSKITFLVRYEDTLTLICSRP